MQSFANTRIGELNEQLTAIRVAVLTQAAKALKLKEARNKLQREIDDIVKKIRKETKTLEDHTVTNLDVAFSCYHGVQQFIRGTIEAPDEHNASHTEPSTQLRLIFVEGRRVKAGSSVAGPSQDGGWVAE